MGVPSLGSFAAGGDRGALIMDGEAALKEDVREGHPCSSGEAERILRARKARPLAEPVDRP
jgi:hypothetical protein